jgi:Holliday junction resolvase-like predicted endonuclease
MSNHWLLSCFFESAEDPVVVSDCKSIELIPPKIPLAANKTTANEIFVRKSACKDYPLYLNPNQLLWNDINVALVCQSASVTVPKTRLSYRRLSLAKQSIFSVLPKDVILAQFFPTDLEKMKKEYLTNHQAVLDKIQGSIAINQVKLEEAKQLAIPPDSVRKALAVLKHWRTLFEEWLSLSLFDYRKETFLQTILNDATVLRYLNELFPLVSYLKVINLIDIGLLYQNYAIDCYAEKTASFLPVEERNIQSYYFFTFALPIVSRNVLKLVKVAKSILTLSVQKERSEGIAKLADQHNQKTVEFMFLIDSNLCERCIQEYCLYGELMRRMTSLKRRSRIVFGEEDIITNNSSFTVSGVKERQQEENEEEKEQEAKKQRHLAQISSLYKKMREKRKTAEMAEICALKSHVEATKFCCRILRMQAMENGGGGGGGGGGTDELISFLAVYLMFHDTGNNTMENNGNNNNNNNNNNNSDNEEEEEEEEEEESPVVVETDF